MDDIESSVFDEVWPGGHYSWFDESEKSLGYWAGTDEIGERVNEVGSMGEIIRERAGDDAINPGHCSQLNALEREGQSSYVGPVGYVSDDGGGDDDNNNEDEVDTSEDSSDESEDFSAPSIERVLYDEKDGQGSFMIGMTFANVLETRNAVNSYGVKFGYKLNMNPNEPNRLGVHCLNEQGCPFKMFISRDGKNPGLAVKSLTLEHRCFRHFSIPSATQSYLAKYFKDIIYKNPKFKVKDMKSEAERVLKINVSIHKCKRAKKIIVQELDGSYRVEFGYLEAYAEALKRSNPRTKAEVELCKEGLRQGKRIFRRMFVMFDACKRNWINGCRPVISLDGCFLKGVCQGQLLTAVGKDGNDQMVPIAWAVIDKETKANWRWFLCWLVQELELGGGPKVTIISDMQKGLIDVVNAILPEAEHRWCAKHIYANWSKKWRGEEFRKKFWICAWSTYEEQFKINLNILGDLSKKACEDLMKYPVRTWCRAYQSNRCKSYMVDNNIAKCFNSVILDARHKPIVSMLEDIRLYALNRIKDNKILCDKWFNEWSPSAMKLYQDNKENAAGCMVIFNGDMGYEIGEGEDKHTVFLDKHLCTCRVWDLTRIPCEHAICALYHSKIDPLSVMSKWYHKSTYQKAHELPLLPVPGKKFMKIDEYQQIEPPPLTKMAGRPRKKRIRASNEPSNNPNKLSRKGLKQCCSLCKIEGHNKSRCPNKGNQVPKTSSVTKTNSKPPSATNNQSIKGATSSSEQRNSNRVTPTPAKRNDSEAPPPAGNKRRQEETTKSLGGTSFKSRRMQLVGIGCHVDLDNGRTIYNPGQPNQRVIVEGEKPMPIHSDPVVRFPIPNEREIRKNKSNSASTHSTLRTINFTGEGSEVRFPSNLPFQPPRLQWMGGSAITTRQLLHQRDIGKARKNNNPQMPSCASATISKHQL